MFCDILQAIGGLLSLTWVRDGKVDKESFLNAQGQISIIWKSAIFTFIHTGIIQQIGETAVNLSNMVTLFAFVEFLFVDCFFYYRQ